MNNGNNDNSYYSLFKAIHGGFLDKALKIARRIMPAPLLNLRHNRMTILPLILRKFNSNMGHADAVKVEELVNTLINKGLDVNVVDDIDLTALHYAAQYNNPRIINALIAAGANVNAESRFQNGRLTPLFLAKDIAVVEELIRGGADVNARDLNGFTPLHSAGSAAISAAIVNALIAAGADVNATSSVERYTPLMMVDSPDVVDALLANGADATLRSVSGLTALHMIVTQSLIDAGADVNARTNAGVTPLRYAVMRGDLHDIELLVNHGADVSSMYNYLSIKILDPATSRYIVNPDIVRIIVLLNNAGITQDEFVALSAKWVRDGLTSAQIAEIVRESAVRRRGPAIGAMARALENREGPRNENQGGGKHRRTTRKRKHRSKKRKNTRRS